MPETIIEIAGPLNENILFNATAERLRGRWSHVVTAGKTIHESLAALIAAAPGGTIPGIRLSLDPQSRTAKRFDPLSETPEGRLAWDRLSEVFHNYREFLGEWKPWPTVSYSLTQNQLKTWMFDMRSLIDQGLAIHVSGPELPSLEEIRNKMPGGRIVKQWMGGSQNPGDNIVDLVEPRSTKGNAADRE